MSQQAYNEAYDDEAELAMDLATAVNEEVRDLFAAGADIVQVDEPWLQSRADQARELALPAIDRAPGGSRTAPPASTPTGKNASRDRSPSSWTTSTPCAKAVAPCERRKPGPNAPGRQAARYAHIVHDRPAGYPFLAELAECSADILAIEAAQPKLDPSVLEPLAAKTVIVGVLDLADPEAETPEVVASRIDAALDVIPPERLQVGPDCGMKYLSRDLAFAKLRALVEGARLVRERLA
jgi:5-methyltetrahydropteroyltriglutamate--homocysteine methyltransferase